MMQFRPGGLDHDGGKLKQSLRIAIDIDSGMYLDDVDVVQSKACDETMSRVF